MSTLFATAATVLHDLRDDDIIALVVANKSDEYMIPLPGDAELSISSFSIAALDLLGTEKCNGDDDSVEKAKDILLFAFSEQAASG